MRAYSFWSELFVSHGRFNRLVRDAQQGFSFFRRILGCSRLAHERLRSGPSLNGGRVALAALAAQHKDPAATLARDASIDLSPKRNEVIDRRVERNCDHEPDSSAR